VQNNFLKTVEEHILVEKFFGRKFFVAKSFPWKKKIVAKSFPRKQFG
jgi:hypothetical protein